MQKLAPCLWFDSEAEEAARYYTQIFPNSRILQTTYYGEGGHKPAGTVLTVTFEILGMEYMALNGGPNFPFTEAVSFIVYCDNQEEIDRYWNRLTAEGGAPVQCGWLKDRYGLSWQIAPSNLATLISSEHPQKAQAVMRALMSMVKLDLAALQDAYDRA